MSIYALTVLRAGSQCASMATFGWDLSSRLAPGCLLAVPAHGQRNKSESSLECLFVRASCVSFWFSEFVLFLLNLWFFTGCPIWLIPMYSAGPNWKSLSLKKSSLNCHTCISHLIAACILSSCLLHTNYLCSPKTADIMPVLFNFISMAVIMVFVI